MTLTHWLAILAVAIGVLLLVAIWFWWQARKEAAENLINLLQEGRENKRLRGTIEDYEQSFRELRTSARTLDDLDEGIRVIVTDLDMRHGQRAVVGSGDVIAPGHRRRRAVFRLRSEERIREAILASGEGRRFVVPVEDVIDITQDGRMH